MNTINIDLQLFDQFITESENHLDMVKDHYIKLSKGYLTESSEYQLIQESEQTTFKEKLKKIIDAIKKFISNFFKNVKEKFIQLKKKLQDLIHKKDKIDTAKVISATHPKFDISKINLESVYNNMTKFSANISQIMDDASKITPASTTTNSLIEKIKKLSSDTQKTMTKDSLGVDVGTQFDADAIKDLIIDDNNKITKNYTGLDVISICDELLKLNNSLGNINYRISENTETLLKSLNKRVLESDNEYSIKLLKFAITQINNVLNYSFKLINGINRAYVEINYIMMPLAKSFTLGDIKQESFAPPVDASFEALLDAINPTRIRVLDLG